MNTEERVKVLEVKSSVFEQALEEVKCKLDKIDAKIDKLTENRASFGAKQSDIERRVDKLEGNQKWFIATLIGSVMTFIIHLVKKWL